MNKIRQPGEGFLVLALTALAAACSGSTEPSHTTPTVDPPPGDWVAMAPIPTPRMFAGSAVANGLLYVVGGQSRDFNAQGTISTADTSLEVYDPATNNWTHLTSTWPREWVGAASVNGIIYAIGGLGLDSASDNFVIDLDRVDAYDPQTRTWTRMASLPIPRGGVATGVVNGVIYAVGGWSPHQLEARVDAYDPATNTWTPKAPMSGWRNGVGVGVVGGILYAIGGVDKTGKLSRVEAYDPTTDSWTIKAPMPTAREGLSVGVVNGLIYAVGGMAENYVITNIVEVYDPATDTWTTASPMSLPRDYLNVQGIGGHLYAVAGGMTRQSDGQSVEYKLNEEYTP